MNRRDVHRSVRLSDAHLDKRAILTFLQFLDHSGNDLEKLHECLAGLSAQQRSYRLRRLLFMSARRGYSNAVKLLLPKFEAEAKGSDLIEGLGSALKVFAKTKPDMITLLTTPFLKYAKGDERVRGMSSTLLNISMSGYSRSVGSLLEIFPETEEDLNNRWWLDGLRSALVQSAKKGHNATTELLVEAILATTKRVFWDETEWAIRALKEALCVSTKNGHPDTTEQLLSAFLNFDDAKAEWARGLNSALEASASGPPEIVKLILPAFRRYVRGEDRISGLHKALKASVEGSYDTTKLLLEPFLEHVKGSKLTSGLRFALCGNSKAGNLRRTQLLLDAFVQNAEGEDLISGLHRALLVSSEGDHLGIAKMLLRAFLEKIDERSRSEALSKILQFATGNAYEMLVKVAGSCISQEDRSHFKLKIPDFVESEAKGETLSDVILRDVINKDDVKPENISELWIDMLNCVADIHAVNWTHLSLEPSKLRTCNSQMKAINSESVRFLSDRFEVYGPAPKSSIRYTAPEAVETLPRTRSGSKGGVYVGKYTDIWSLGCILEEMLDSYSAKLLISCHGLDEPWTSKCIATIRACKSENPDTRPTAASLLERPDGLLEAVN